MGKRGRPPHPDILTPREWQVLELLRQGLTNEQIAGRLDISLAGAKYHVSEILTKLGVSTREEAAAWEPEAVAVPWWQRALAWVPRRAWPLAAVAGALATLGVLAWVVFGASAGEDDNTVASQPSESPSSTETAPATPAATPEPLDVFFPPLSIPNPQDTKLFFIRGAPGYLEPGALWMSDLDGSRAEVLIAEPAVQRVIGIVNHWQTGNATVYYFNTEMIASFSEMAPREFGQQTVYSLDLVTRERTELLSYETWDTPGADVDVTADGRLLAYADRFGLAIYDLANGENRPLFEADPPEACFGPPPGARSCKQYSEPVWSPDGRFVVIYEGFGSPSVVDTVDGTVAPIFSESEVVIAHEWARSTPSICLIDNWQFDQDQETRVMAASAPGWQATTILNDYAPNLAAGVPNWQPLRCVWVDETRVALLYYGQTHYDQTDPRNRYNEVLIIDTNSGDVRKLQEHRFLFDWDIRAIPERKFLISGPRPGNHPDPLTDSITPEVVDVETNARHPILTTEDWVVAAVPAEQIAP